MASNTFFFDSASSAVFGHDKRQERKTKEYTAPARSIVANYIYFFIIIIITIFVSQLRF